MEREKMRELMRVALEYRTHAYAPYSQFKVGAGLLAENGQIFGGCNIESASYTPTNCAERTAFFKAVSEGVYGFTAIAIVGGKDGTKLQLCAPCGVCRQVMMEFCDPETFLIILGSSEDDFEVFTLKELLPLGFGPDNLK